MLDARNVEALAAFVVEDGFDAETIRLLSAWQYVDSPWSAPARPCPDDGRPTLRAWRWLMSGLEIDYVALADIANVSSSVARQKTATLINTRLVYPGGQISEGARAALQAAIKERVQSASKAEKKKPAKPELDN